MKELEQDHPIRLYAGIISGISLDETQKGPLVMVGGDRILVTKAERQRLVQMLHFTYLSGTSMWETSRNIWYWAGSKNQCHIFAIHCEVCKMHDISNVRQKPAIPDDITTMQLLDLVGVDLLELGGLDYICVVDKASVFIFFENI